MILCTVVSCTGKVDPLTAQTGIFKVIPTRQQGYHRVEVGWNNAETHAASALAMRKGPFGRVRISQTGRLHVHPQTHEQGSKDGIGNGAGGVGVGDGGGGGRGDGLRMREPMHHLSEGEEEREGHALSARRDARVRELNGRAHTIFDEDAEEEGPEGKTLRGIEPLQPRTLSEAGTPVRA